MSAAVWYGRELFLGKIAIGGVALNWTPGPRGETIAALCHLPGARCCVGVFADEAGARAAVERSAQSRIKGMFGAGIDTTAIAVREGRTLRVAARAILRAGVWTCDRPAEAGRMFDDLRRGAGVKPEDMPGGITPQPGAPAGSSDPVPDDFDPIDRDRTGTA